MNALSLVLAFPAAVRSGFRRLKQGYTFFAHVCATVPGGIGYYLHGAYYQIPLREFALSSRVSFGSFFAHPEARIGARLYIGSYRIIGRASTGAGSLVTRPVPDDCIAVGNPAKVIRGIEATSTESCKGHGLS